MFLKENQLEIEKLLQKKAKAEDGLETASLAVKRVQAKILQARDEGKDEKALKLQADLDAAKNKVEITELSVKKTDEALRVFIGEKLDDELKRYPKREAEYQKHIKSMLARIGTNLKNAQKISNAIPGSYSDHSGRGHIKLCLSKMSEFVLRGVPDVETAEVEELSEQGADLAFLKNLQKNIIGKEHAINRIYGKILRRDFL